MQLERFFLSDNWARRVRCSAVLIVGGLLVFRITLGVDLTDESYYASFVDGWIKTGIQKSTALGLHQTAALLVYPFAFLYAKVLGSVDGLALFLRALYLALTVCVAAIFYQFVARIRTKAVATCAALFVASFIPFSLPAPSYNTLGMLGMIAALASAAIYLLEAPLESDRRRIAWAACSAASWTLAAIAYPTLIAVQVIFILGLIATLGRDGRRTASGYLASCALTHSVGAAALFAVFGLEKFQAMLAFSNASLQVSSGFEDKLRHLMTPLSKTPIFGLLSLSMVGLGLITDKTSTRLRRVLMSLGVTGVFIVATLVGPVLYAKTHDLVVLAALLGAGIALADKQDSQAHRVLRLLMMVGFFGGVVTTLTATNGMVNFAIGGFFAAALALVLVLHSDSKSGEALHLSVLTLATGLCLWSAFTFIYGEPSNPLLNRPRTITDGVFKNLLTNSEQAEAISETTRLLESIRPHPDNILIFGRLPGIYLLTDAAPLTLSTWDFNQHNAPLPRIEQFRNAFFSDPRHRAAIGVTVSDPWTKPPSVAEGAALSHYVNCQTRLLSKFTVTIYAEAGSVQARNCGGG